MKNVIVKENIALTSILSDDATVGYFATNSERAYEEEKSIDHQFNKLHQDPEYWKNVKDNKCSCGRHYSACEYPDC